MMQHLYMVVPWLALVVLPGSFSMTVNHGEEHLLPEELKPIATGGSWYGDIAKEKLSKKVDELVVESNREMEDKVHQHVPAALHNEAAIIPQGGDSKGATGKGKFDIKTALPPGMPQPVVKFLPKLVAQAARKLPLSSPVRRIVIADDESDEDGPETEEAEISYTISSLSKEEFLKLYEEELEMFFRNLMTAASAERTGSVGGHLLDVNIERRDPTTPQTDVTQGTAEPGLSLGTPAVAA